MKKHYLLAVVMLVAVIAAIFLVKSPPQEHDEPFRIGVVTWVGFGPLYVARDKGFFDEEGVKVEIQRIEDLGALRGALASGKLDAIVHTVDSWASAAAEGLPAVCVLKIDQSFGGDGIVADSSIKTIADLKGKSVAFPRGLAGHFFLLHLMKQSGLSADDIKERYMEAADAAAAFIAKKVDAAVTWEPFLSEAGQTDNGHIIATTADYPGLITDILIVRKSVVSSRPADIKRVLKGWFRAVDFTAQNGPEAAAIMERNFGIEVAEVEGMLSGLRFSSLEENIAAFGDNDAESPIVKTFNSAGQVYSDAGLIKSPVSGAQYFDGSFLRALK
ncbi:MAG: hypothetical protein A3G18_00765 [Rhodospirillales bacterium RIFCSPLOWO2_12_FULL_58_28]|nr:MAG: hypothetical protein A3H92_12610 [Rhodospirillales bacterium RIFCSPLOWO2_02_FULL_58_16]OHC77056.1 MAG: hypothetical protein A3G18_00765 [Rhodospirillales bacterium RIFCSPLOWO2_12_FULL_58_28]